MEFSDKETEKFAANAGRIDNNIHELRALLSHSPYSESMDDALKTIQLVLEFTAQCRRNKDGSGTNLLEYFIANESLLEKLSVEDIIKCSDISTAEVFGTAEVTRRLLDMAKCKCLQQEEPDWGKVGELYQRLVETSTSRQEVSIAVMIITDLHS